MAVTDIPLKIKDVDGNLQRFSTSEENYLAYQMGLGLAERSDSDVSALTLNSSGATEVGSYTNTFYTDPVGTHPGSSITAPSSITTTLYQVNGNADSSGSDWRIPVGFQEADKSFREMNDSDFDSLMSRLLTTYTTNDYPGVYKLDSDGFSDSDWDVHLSSVFSDTQTDGTTVDYNIFQRQSITPPSTVSPVFVRRSAGRSGSYDGGVQEFTDPQIKYTFAQKAKTLTMSNGIGTYQLRSSAQGAPSDPGTWVSKGIAIDTRKEVSDSNFTQSYASDYTGDFSGSSTTEYAAQFTTNYSGLYTKQYGGTYTGSYAGVYGGLLDKSYVGDYVGVRAFAGARTFSVTVPAQYLGTVSQQFTGFFLRQYTRQFTAFFVKSYVATFSGAYKREGSSYTASYRGSIPGPSFAFFPGPSYTATLSYIGEFSSFYVRWYTRQFSANFSGAVAKQYTGISQALYTGTTTNFYTGIRFFSGSRNFTGTYTGQFTRSYGGSFSGSFSGQFSSQYLGTYARQYTAQYAQQYLGSYTGSYSGAIYATQYAGQTIQSSSSTIETYTLYVRTN